MLYAVMPAAFQNMQEAGDVAGHVDMRILGGIAHAGLRGQVDDTLRLMGGEQALDGLAVGQIGVIVRIAGMFQQRRQTRLLQRTS